MCLLDGTNRVQRIDKKLVPFGGHQSFSLPRRTMGKGYYIDMEVTSSCSNGRTFGPMSYFSVIGPSYKPSTVLDKRAKLQLIGRTSHITKLMLIGYHFLQSNNLSYLYF